MSLAQRVSDLATRVSTEAKSLRTLINGNVAGLTGLTTTAKSNLVAAINEVNDKPAGGGGAASLTELSDVTVTAPVAGHILHHDGTQFINVLGSSQFQPTDADLTAIANLAGQTAYGRNLLTLADQAGLMALLSAASTLAQGIVELATVPESQAGASGTLAVTPAGLAAAIADLRASILGTNVPAALDTLDELAAALGDDANFASSVTTSLAGKQPLDDDLTSIAAQGSAADQMLYATGPQAWALTTLTAFARTLLDDADAAAARTTLSVYSQAEIGNPETNFVTVFEAGLV